ncbi:class I SAM-dependent methyltransferase [Streptomyces sp. NPDC060275]|uniref:class I SAM-dependent methyltransferase n=1 Tax=Streptomyces sp. NPDC060275 TaxID=3347090 RepID=UPI00365ABF8B
MTAATNDAPGRETASERYGETLFVRDTPEHRRLRLLGEVFDPLSIRTLDAIGVRPGMRCLEIGAGGGSMARWLCARTAPAQVVATDLDVSPLVARPEENLLPLVHDVTRDTFPAHSFDLVHARFVLNHLPERDEVLKRIVRWLRPGGVLVVESFSWFPVDGSPDAGYRKVLLRWSELLRDTIGTDSRWARNYPSALAHHGLRDLGANTVTQHVRGGSDLADFWRLTVAMSKEQLLGKGYLSAKEYEEFAARMRDVDFWDLAPALTQAWGRKAWGRK